MLAGWSFGAIPSMAGPVTGLQPAADGPTLRLADGQVSGITWIRATSDDCLIRRAYRQAHTTTGVMRKPDRVA